MANRNIEHAVRLALLAGAASAGAYAPASFAQDQEIEQVIVTGSRIPQPNIEGTSPVTTLGSAEIKFEGTQQVEQLINNLPQAFADQSGTLANGASGTATINLRNLGAQRTLVLVNGRRMPAGSPQYIAPDVNQIPASLIQRVEVLTGGASAVYGSDAVAGVVNFIMNDSFEGVQVDLNYSAYQHNNDNKFMRNMLRGANDGSGNKNGWIFQAIPGAYLPYGIETPQSPNSVWDGDDYNLGITLGSNFADGKGNAVLYFGYDKMDPVLQSQRDYSNCSILETTTSAFGSNASGQYCGGSTTTYPGRFRVVKSPQAAANTLSYWNHGLDEVTGLPTGTFNSSGPFPFYNYGPTNYYQRPQERWQADAFLKYDLTDTMQAYAQFMFMDNTTRAQIAPSGAFGVTATINCNDNPYLNQVGWRDIVCYDYSNNGTPDDPTDDISNYTPTRGMIFNRRNVEGKPRVDNLELTSYQGVIGLRGQWFDHWDYDVSAQFGKVVYNENYANDASVTRIRRALDVVVDPEWLAANPGATPAQQTQHAVCRSVVDGSDPNCVPWNIWVINPATGVLDASAGAAYIVAPGFSSGNTNQTVVTATTTSNLGDYGIILPTATDGVGLALGTEYRQEGLVYSADALYQTGDLSGQGGPSLPVKGSYNVWDIFAEVRAPLVQDAAFAKDITFNGSYRYSDYSQGFNTNTYGVGLDWQIVDDVKLRGSFQHAVRAPNIIELYTPISLGLFNWLTGDPCGRNTSFTAAQCAASGLTNPALVGSRDLTNPAQQYNGLFGGNASLEPETADTWTAGIVFTPTFLEGFSLTVDYFNIKIEDTIGTVPPALKMQLCGESLDPTSVYCQAITRDETGSVWALPEGYIESIITNTGTTETSGIDVNADYLVRMGDWGSLNFALIGTWLDKYEVQPISGESIKYECKGYFGSTWCLTPYPDWKHKFRTTWSTPWNVDLSLNWRYIASVTDESCSSNPLLSGENPFTLSHCFKDQKTLDAQNYIDLAMVYTFGEHYTMSAGINNLMDKEPPLTSNQGAPYGNGNTFPAVYDALGRYLFVGLTAKF